MCVIYVVAFIVNLLLPHGQLSREARLPSRILLELVELVLCRIGNYPKTAKLFLSPNARRLKTLFRNLLDVFFVYPERLSSVR